MLRMGFNIVWIDWMKEFYSTAHVSVLVNGSPSDTFHMERGVRQGDLLSSFLFLIAVKDLKCILDKVREMGLLRGIHFNNLTYDLSILQFADDTLLFLPAIVEMVSVLKRFL